jgi:hypothetical protein
MNSLREITDFVGLSGPNRFQGPPGTPIKDPTMRSVGLMVPLLSSQEKTNMRVMIQGLQRLPPISLEVDTADTEGEIPLLPKIHVHASGGAILRTSLGLFTKGTTVLLGNRTEVPNTETVGTVGTVAAVGNYVIEVRRTGIPNTGITTLLKLVDVVAMPGRGGGTGTGGTGTGGTGTGGPPTPTCAVQQGQPSFGTNTANVRVSGAGFLAGEDVQILDQEGTIETTTKADGIGRYDAEFSVIRGHYVFHAHGQKSGRISNSAGITV